MHQSRREPDRRQSNHEGVALMLTNEGPGLIPALDPSAPYTSRLSARSALYTDLHVLLDASETSLSSSFRSLVIDENCLVRNSVATRRKIWTELKSRYILDTEHPLFAAFLREWRRSGSEAERVSLHTYFFPSMIAWSQTSGPNGYFRSCVVLLRNSELPISGGLSIVRPKSTQRSDLGRTRRAPLSPRNTRRAFATSGWRRGQSKRLRYVQRSMEPRCGS